MAASGDSGRKADPTLRPRCCGAVRSLIDWCAPIFQRVLVNPVVHFELPYENRDRICAFYETAFGWQVQKLGEDMGRYVVATTVQADAKPGAPAGAINGG